MGKESTMTVSTKAINSSLVVEWGQCYCCCIIGMGPRASRKWAARRHDEQGCPVGPPRGSRGGDRRPCRRLLGMYHDHPFARLFSHSFTCLAPLSLSLSLSLSFSPDSGDGGKRVGIGYPTVGGRRLRTPHSRTNPLCATSRTGVGGLYVSMYDRKNVAIHTVIPTYGTVPYYLHTVR